MVRYPPATGQDAIYGKLDRVVDENRHEENAEFRLACPEDGCGEWKSSG